MKALDDNGLLENTLIVFSSDNGPVLNDGYYDDAVEKLGDHRPMGGLRGGKYSLYEAGTRVPFIVYWKGKIEPKVSSALICQVDLLSSISSYLGSDVRTSDSQDLLDVLFGRSLEGRENLVIEATSRTAFRQGDWLMIPPYKGVEINTNVNIELGNSQDYQLFDLKKDIGQQKNLALDEPEKLRQMIKDFEKIRGLDYKDTEELELH